MKPYYEHAGITIYHGDCRELLPNMSADVVVTDPPYPDYHAVRYGYAPYLLDALESFRCRQLIFWSAKVAFPLSTTAVHIWDKANPASPYERIMERHGGSAYRVFRAQLINNAVAARFHKDEWTQHPSQKPQRLMRDLLRLVGSKMVILDPFCGSGSTLKAAKRLQRVAVGIEIDERYCEIAARRLSQEVLDFSPSVDAVDPVGGTGTEGPRATDLFSGADRGGLEQP